MRHRYWLPVPAPGIFFMTCAAAALCGCAVGPDFHTPAAPPTDHYLAGTPVQHTAGAAAEVGQAQTLVVDQDIPAQWWSLFHSDPLDALVRTALHDSPTIEAAAAALRAAQEGYVAQRGALFPQVSGQFEVQREAAPGAAFGLPELGTSTFTLFDAGVNVTYNFDVFGATRRQLEAAAAQSEYERWELEGARLALAGNVVTTAITAASLNDQIAATNDILATERDQLRIIVRQRDAGAAAQVDVLTQQAQVSMLEATLPGLQKSLAQAGHRLAVLSGQTPDHADTAGLTLSALTLPTQLPVSLPAKLVRQRPDVLAAEAQLHSATAQVGVAIADMLPQINLTATLGGVSTRLSTLLASGNTFWSAGADLSQTLFAGGALWHRKLATDAALDQAGAQYRTVVLGALQNVADTLYALQFDAQAVEANQAAEQAARSSLEATHANLTQGSITYLDLLNAEQAQAQAISNLEQARANHLADTAALFVALGGGWWNRPAHVR